MTNKPSFPAKLDLSLGKCISAKGVAIKSVAKQSSTEAKNRTAIHATTSVANAASTTINAVTHRAQKILAITPSVVGLGLDSSVVRTKMVQKLADQGVQDERVLAAMNATPRHRFVDTALANQAYEDTSLPIGWGQTISKPNVVARMLALLCEGKEAPMGRVLEVGTGCGYQAAVLSHLAQEVYSIERLRGLYEKAQQNISPFRIKNLHLLFGDGMLGFAQGAPYAGIIAAAGGEAIPQAWIDQLAVGGRIVAPVIQAEKMTNVTTTLPAKQCLVVIDKTSSEIKRTVLELVQFVPLKSGIG